MTVSRWIKNRFHIKSEVFQTYGKCRKCRKLLKVNQLFLLTKENKEKMLKLENGRPKDFTGRPDKEIRTYDLLDTLGIEYKRIDHEEAMTMEVCEEIDEALQATICKNLF